MMMQAESYGLAIPKVYGLSKVSVIPTWLANLRQAGSDKKFKEKKKGPPTYNANIDMLLGHNPILGVLRAWANNQDTYAVQTQSMTYSVPWYGSASVTIDDPNFLAVIGVYAILPYDVSFDDYGGVPQSLSGNYNAPMYNVAVLGPDPSSANSYRRYPLTYRWNPSYGPVVYLDGVEAQYGNPLAGATIVITYAVKAMRSEERRIGKECRS